LPILYRGSSKKTFFVTYHLAYSFTYIDSQPKYFFFSLRHTRSRVSNSRTRDRQQRPSTAAAEPADDGRHARVIKTIIPTGSRINDSVPCGTMFFGSAIRFKYNDSIYRAYYTCTFLYAYIFKSFGSCSAGREYCCRHCRGRHCTPPPPPLSSRSHSSDSAALLSSSAAVISIAGYRYLPANSRE